MHRKRRLVARGLYGLGFWLLAATGVPAAVEARVVRTAETSTVVELAQGAGTREGELRPRYQPVPEEPSCYDSSYLFAATRGVADSTVVPALKLPLFLFTVPLDLALLPFAAIGGFF